jgi:hypothetical protein
MSGRLNPEQVDQPREQATAKTEFCCKLATASRAT